MPSLSDLHNIVPVENAVISKFYGMSYDSVLNRPITHGGLDFSCAVGTSVKAVLDGSVKQIVSDDLFDNNYVTIEHADGEKTIYRYIVPATGLKVGDTVKQGDIIGAVAEGGSESDQGVHLHFEIAKSSGGIVDPAEYFNPDDLVYADGVE